MASLFTQTLFFCRSKEFIRQRKLVAESTPHAKELSYTGSSSSQSAHKTMHVFSQSYYSEQKPHVL